MYLLLLMVVNMYKRMGKVVIKILQGSAVTLTMLQCICAKNYENCLAVDKVIAKINYQAYFFWPTLYISHTVYCCSDDKLLFSIKKSPEL